MDKLENNQATKALGQVYLYLLEIAAKNKKLVGTTALTQPKQESNVSNNPSGMNNDDKIKP